MGSLLFVSCTSAVSPGQAPPDLLLGVPEPDVMGPVKSRPAPGGLDSPFLILFPEADFPRETRPGLGR